MKKLIFSLFFILSGTLSLSAQGLRATPTNEFGIFLGTSYYTGDLNPTGHFKFPEAAAGLLYRRNINPRAAFRINGLAGYISADDAKSNDEVQNIRNLSFRSFVTELSGQFEFNFFPYEIGNPKYFPATPYLFAGLAIFRHNPKAKLNGDWEALRNLHTEGQETGNNTEKEYKLIQASIPFGVGIKFNLGPGVGMAIEWGLRKTFTDYLDDVSTVYFDPSQMGAGAATLADQSQQTVNDPTFSNVGRQRGNSKTKDWYAFAGITITFQAKKSIPCPSYH